VEFNFIPDTGDVPVVADMSSNILSRPIDVSVSPSEVQAQELLLDQRRNYKRAS